MSTTSRGRRTLPSSYYPSDSPSGESIAHSGHDRARDDVNNLRRDFREEMLMFKDEIKTLIKESVVKPRESRESESKISRYFNENDRRINATNLRFEEVINRQEQKYKNLENMTLGLTTMIKESHSIQNSRLDELSRMISSNKNLIVWILIIVAIILGVVLVVLLIWIIVKIVRNDNKDDK
tara:strand:- start:4755 stop:5297 length:543 start_codon:yes stop_codon:yes gene_type:complete